MPELKRGSQGPEVGRFYDYFTKWAASYAFLLGKRDLYFGSDEERFTLELQRRLKVPQTGIFGDLEASRTGYRWTGTSTPPVVTRRKIWVYSAAGTGGQWFQGPQYEVGKWCEKVLKLNHQPVDYPAGGFLGLAGGNAAPTVSYNESIAGLAVELERLIAACPDLTSPDVEFWFMGYSQSADGLKRAVTKLFGDGGRFAHLRARINGLVLFGDPTRAPGPTKVGNNPKGSGIARWDAPQWVDDLTWSITTHFDMFPCATDDTLLPLFYEWFVKAETELPFVAYSAGIVIPALASYLGIAGMLLGPALAGMIGVSLNMIGALITSFGGGESPNPELVQALSAQGLMTPQGIVKVFATLAALAGIQVHGEYHLPKPEFNGRTGIQVGCDIVAAFRR